MKYIINIKYIFAFISLVLILISCKKSRGPYALVPTVTTTKPHSITPTSANTGGYVLGNGGASVYYSGICYSSHKIPTISDSVRAKNVGRGVFHNVVTGLKTDSTYYVRAYAINSVGVAYGEEYSFKTVPSVFSIGQNYQGGYIVYIDSTGLHGLIAAPADLTNEQWGCNDSVFTVISGANGTAIGSGQANTTAIVTSCGDAPTAAKLCNDLSVGGYDDWYLPSKEELYFLYLNLGLKGLGGFTKGYYWSSSQGSMYTAWMYYFYDGSAVNLNKENQQHVRAVRSF